MSEYIEEALQFLFVPSYIYTPEYQLEYWIDFIIIDATSDDSGLDNIENYVSTSIIESALDYLIPYSEITFVTYKIDIDDDSLQDLKEVYDETTEVYYNYGICDTLHILDSEALIPEADKLIIRPEGMVTIPILIFVEDHCATVDGLASGIAQSYDDGSPFGIFIPTGMSLLEYSGLTQTSIHEIGHILGLFHPHDRFIGIDEEGYLNYETDWYWDQSATPMTYLDNSNNLWFDGLNSDTIDRGHVLYLLNQTQYNLYEIWTIIEEKGYTYDTLPWEYRSLLYDLDRNWDSSITEFKDGNYFDYYGGGLDSFDYALNAYNTAEELLNGTSELENYTPYYLVKYGTDPNNADTDGDGIIDSYETMTGFWSSKFNTGTNPIVADSDGDGLDDGYEITIDTNPTNKDSDYDWSNDGLEINSETNPNEWDTDGDNLSDGHEELIGSNPLAMDTDGDGLDDGYEVLILGSDPTLVDTDGDGFNDAEDNWPTFNFQLTMIVSYYKVENTDFWDGDDVYFVMFIEDSDMYITSYIDGEDEYNVWYNFTYDVDDNQMGFDIGLQAWDYDGHEGSEDDVYDIDGQNEGSLQLDLYYYPEYGFVGGDAYEDYEYEGIDYGYVRVNTDGSTDGDYNNHDAEVTIYLGWNIL